MGYKAVDFALMRAIGARLIAAYTEASETCPWSVNPAKGKDFPYGVLGVGTENDGFSSKNTDGAEATHTLRIYAATDKKARELAAIAIEDIMDDTNRLSLAAPFYQCGPAGLDLNEIVKDNDERGEHYGALIRFRFKIGQTAS